MSVMLHHQSKSFFYRVCHPLNVWNQELVTSIVQQEIKQKVGQDAENITFHFEISPKVIEQESQENKSQESDNLCFCNVSSLSYVVSNKQFRTNVPVI